MSSSLEKPMTKLYEVPKNSLIKVLDKHPEVETKYKVKQVIPEPNETLTFKKIDGMFSLSYNSKNEVVRLAAWTNVQVIGKVEEQNGQ